MDSTLKQALGAVGLAPTGFAKWLTEADPPKSDRTIEAYMGAVRRVVGHRAVGAQWTNVDFMRSTLGRWRQVMGEARRAGRLSDSKIRVEVAGIRAFYRYAVAEGYLTQNPTEGLKSISRTPRLPRPMQRDEVTKLLSVMAVAPLGALDTWRDRALVECFICGLRNVEAVRLNLTDLQYELAEESLRLRVMGKGMRPREVLMHPNGASFVAGYLLRRLNEPVFLRTLADIRLLEDPQPLQRLFRALDQYVLRRAEPQPVFVQGKRRITRQDVNRIFRFYRSLAQLPSNYGPHSLRHTCGTEMLEAGVNLRVIQEILGHQHIEQTTLYTKVLASARSAAARALPTAGAAL